DLALARPDRVAALVLVAPAVRGAPEADEATFEPALEVLSAALDAADEAGDLDQVNRLEAHIWLDGPDAPEGRGGGLARAPFPRHNRVAPRPPAPGRRGPAGGGGGADAGGGGRARSAPRDRPGDAGGRADPGSAADRPAP